MTRFGSLEGAGIDDLVERTLARAQMAREPSLADRERVRSSLRAYLDGPRISLNDVAPHDVAPHGVAPHDVAPHDDALQDDALQDDVVSGVRQIMKEAQRPRARRLPRWVRPWAAAPVAVQALVCVSAFAGTVGLWLGTKPAPEASATARVAATEVPGPRASAGRRGAAPTGASPAQEPRSDRTASDRAPSEDASDPAPATPTAPPSAPARTEPGPAPLEPALARRGPAGDTPAPVSPALATPWRAAPVAAEAAPLPAHRPLTSVTLRTTAPLDAGRLAPSAPASSPARNSPNDARFLEAVRMVQRAQRSIENGAPSVALSLLAELDARFPAAMLNEERLATRVLALCAGAAVARAREVAAELLARNPSSIYAARIAQSCARTGAPPATRR